MSYAEHAIENAVYAIENGVDFKNWREQDGINFMYISATPNEVWEMAQWVVYTKCVYCENKCDDKLCPERGVICDGS